MRILTIPIRSSATAMARKCRTSVYYDDGQHCPIGELTCPFQGQRSCYEVTKNDWFKLIKEEKNGKSNA